MSEIFVARPGNLRPSDKANLRKAGIVVVECDPDAVKFMRPDVTMNVDGMEMLRLALRAMRNYDSCRATFTKLLDEYLHTEKQK